MMKSSEHGKIMVTINLFIISEPLFTIPLHGNDTCTENVHEPVVCKPNHGICFFHIFNAFS